MKLEKPLFVILCFFVFLQSPVKAGAWGVGSFDNDDALDFVASFENKPSLETVVVTLREVANYQGYLEAPVSAYAIVAAEILAAMNDHSNPSLPDSIDMWSKIQSKPNIEHLQIALRALEKVRDFELSELAQLWSDNVKLLEKWEFQLTDLESRLQ